jgi:hypothetical protein
VAQTQAVFYRDERGVEPVDEFIEALAPKPAAKIDAAEREECVRRAILYRDSSPR